MCLVYKKYLNIYIIIIIIIYIMQAGQESSAPSPTSPVLVASGHQDQRRRPGPKQFHTYPRPDPFRSIFQFHPAGQRETFHGFLDLVAEQLLQSVVTFPHICTSIFHCFDAECEAVLERVEVEP